MNNGNLFELVEICTFTAGLTDWFPTAELQAKIKEDYFKTVSFGCDFSWIIRFAAHRFPH